jgi:hypothetical protein
MIFLPRSSIKERKQKIINAQERDSHIVNELHIRMKMKKNRDAINNLILKFIADLLS